MSIEWKVAREIGNCTTMYIGTLTQRMTVQQFLNTELGSKNYGTVRVNDTIIYNYRPTQQYIIHNDLFKVYKNEPVQSIIARGGWGRMDYSITVEEPFCNYRRTSLPKVDKKYSF